ncbi:DUF924 family protein [Cognaticolwellia mytili]|uniref:DUF924 family protein n=1 Tax=Cognaticolwellia mytili TaxID=1888913 RepID=UPI000A177768|nr:DUF924 family protein [Cognaticolwellia mytili]
MDYKVVIDFWFNEISPVQWWVKDEAFDQEIRKRFLDIHQRANRGELYPWRATAEGRLAEIIVLDQFSRNIFRDNAKAFACDTLALVLAQEAVSRQEDQDIAENRRSFMYLPYMHSESAIIHQEALKLYSKLGNASNLAFEIKHQDIITKFGRYPHRNVILSRESSAEELVFLQQPDSSF